MKKIKGFIEVGYIKKQENGLYSAFLKNGKLLASDLESEDEARLYILSHTLS